MRTTRAKSGKVAAGTDGDPPKKKGKQLPASSRGKRKATSTTSQPASVDGAALNANAANAAASIAAAEMSTSTVVAAAVAVEAETTLHQRTSVTYQAI